MDGSFVVRGQNEQKLNWREAVFAAVLSQIKVGQITVTFPSGAKRAFVGKVDAAGTFSRAADMQILSWSAIKRIAKSGAIGLGESYMDGDWDSTNLTFLLCVLAANMEEFESKLPSLKRYRILEKLQHFTRRNTKKGSRKNIAYHYDLGNDFYSLWLDQTMSYSSAIFDPKTINLEEAQKRKYQRLANEVGIEPGDTVLEIGCGWGGFAEYAVTELNCKVDCITLSKEQLLHAETRLKNIPEGVNAQFRLIDYRDVTGSYDRIISIEMLEAVGEDFWPSYFSKIQSLLKPGGRAGIQVITIENKRFETYRTGVDFIQKHIFPGGMLPSDEVFNKQVSASGMEVQDVYAFGLDYAKTLACWRDVFLSQLLEVKKQGFDDRFVRMWLFYLAYCEAGFRQKTIDVHQYVIG